MTAKTQNGSAIDAGRGTKSFLNAEVRLPTWAKAPARVELRPSQSNAAQTGLRDKAVPFHRARL